MSGSVKEDLGAGAGTGAPDSWEVSDLDDRMSRLILKKKNSPSSSSSVPEFANTGGSGSPAAAVSLFSAASSSSSLALSLSTSASAPSLVGIESSGGVSSNQIDQFLLEALQNPRERLSILRIEQDVQKFIFDPTQQQLEFQQLPTSYLRLAAHRVAQHYFLQSMVILDNNLPDGSGSRIIVRKSNECRLPPIRLADIAVNVPQEDGNSGMKLAIKQRPHKRSQIANSGNKHSSTSNHPKSVEERKEEYNRARARIFNSNSGSDDGKSEIEPLVQDTFRQCSVSNRVDDRTISEGHELNLSRSLSDVSSGNSRSGRGRTVEPVGRYKANNKVAIIRDREVDRKDPDYDRNYDRYMQRFDPGLGYNGGPYSIQPMFSPAVNYNTEFPQLGPIYRPRISLEHQPRPILQHLRGPWPAASTPPGVSYGRPEAMMASFSPDHVSAHAHAHSTSAIYMHPSHYSFPRPGVPFIHPPEHAYQPFTQPQQHHEPTFGVARPR